MNIKYSKIFDYFEYGIKELVNIVPEIKDYIGDSYDRETVLNYILDLFKEDLPYIGNEDSSNLSITLDQQSLVFLMDNGMSFSFYIQTETHDDTVIVTGFNFIFNYSNPYMNKRRFKRLTEGFESYGWKIENNDTNRIPDTKETFKEEETATKEDTNVQNIPNKNYQDYTEAVPLPTFIQDDEEPPKQEEEVIKQYTPSSNKLDRLRMNSGKYAPLIESEVQEDPLDPIGIANRYSTLTDFYRSSDFRENIDYWYSENKPTQALQEVESIILSNSPNIDSIQEQTEPNMEVQQVDARNIPSRLKGLQRPVILPNGKVAEETKYLQEPTNSIGLEELDPAFFSIRPGQDQATVIIKYEGREFPYNVNEQRAGIIRDPANKKITIDYVVYDYRVYKAYKLPDDFEPDNATYVGATPNMISHQQLPDEAFVPRETIMKNADIDIDAIQEEAIKRERFKEKMTGIKTPPLWNRDTVQPLPQQSSGNVLRKGKAFVIEQNHGIPKPQIEFPSQYNDGYGPQQSVQITNEDQIYN